MNNRTASLNSKTNNFCYKSDSVVNSVQELHHIIALEFENTLDTHNRLNSENGQALSWSVAAYCHHRSRLASQYSLDKTQKCLPKTS